MTDNITDLIAEARAWTRDDADGAPRNLRRLARQLADALEATVKEMHARELHHFEEEKLRAEAEVERDRYRDALVEALGNFPSMPLDSEDCGYVYNGEPIDDAYAVLSRALKGKTE